MTQQTIEIGTCASEATHPTVQRSGIGEVAAGGAFTCDFELPADLPMDQVPAILERDRAVMAARPGMLRKQVPIGLEAGAGRLTSGGRYLFETLADAEAYCRWVAEDFVLDGVPFLERPYISNPECHAWSVIGAHDFGDIHAAQTVLRTERWRLPEGDQRAGLETAWTGTREQAEWRGLTSVWLLYSQAAQLASLVYLANRIAPGDPRQPDLQTLTALASAPPLGQGLEGPGWAKLFDRTQWVLTVWFPVASGEPSLWPNSPPFPAPSGQ